jgi:hypothetical protein
MAWEYLFVSEVILPVQILTNMPSVTNFSKPEMIGGVFETLLLVQETIAEISKWRYGRIVLLRLQQVYRQL